MAPLSMIAPRKWPRLGLGGLFFAAALACAGNAPAGGSGGVAVPPGTAGGEVAPTPVAPTQAEAAPIRETYEVVRAYPHDAGAFTQGLVYVDGTLYEGTGRRGASSLRRVELETGRVLEQADLPASLFGEGITVRGDRIYQLTWLSGVGFVYDRASLQPIGQFRQVTEGWGLTHDGVHLIQSDGSSNLYFLDPEDMSLVRQVEVHDASGPVTQINELELVDGEVYANVWHSNEILRISPLDGRVIGRIDMAGLLDPAELRGPEAVLNGIAYDAERGRFFVTGKLWPTLFEVRFVRAR